MSQPSGSYIFRPAAADWTGAGVSPLGAESAATELNTHLGPLQAFVDFDTLGPQFWVVFGGNVASSSFPNMTWRLRVGGTYETGPGASVCDGDIAMEQTVSVSAFGVFRVKQLVTNHWSGMQLVTLTGQQPMGDEGFAFSQRPTLLLLPTSPGAQGGTFAISHNTGLVPAGLVAALGAEGVVPAFTFVMDPNALSSTQPPIRFGGRLIGTGSAVFRLRQGGTYLGTDGSILAESPAFGPGTFQWDIDPTSLGTDLFRLQVTYERASGSSLAIGDPYLLFLPPPVVGREDRCIVQYQIDGEFEVNGTIERVIRQWSHDLRFVEAEQALITLAAIVKAAAGSTGVFRVRIGGTPDFVDGVLATELTTTATAWTNLKAQAAIINPRAQVLIKLTGVVPAGSGGAFIRGATITALEAA